MSDFTITKVLGAEPFRSKHGSDLIAYTVTFEGEQGKGAAEHRRKATSPPPMEREVIDAEIVHEGEKVLLKRVYRPQGGPGAPRSNSAGKGSKGGGDFRSPAQIMRGDAHGKALHWCDIKVAAGEWKPITWEQYIAMVDRFYDDLIDAPLRAEFPSV